MEQNLRARMMKSIACLLKVIILLSGMLPALPKDILADWALTAEAVSGLNEGDYERTYGDYNCLLLEDRASLSILQYNGHDSELIVPAVIDGLKVVEINNEAFKNHTSLKSVTIPYGIKYIEPYAFWGCSNLNSITLSRSVLWSDAAAFLGCSATIYGYSGSNAEAFSKTENYSFISRGQAVHTENGFTYMVNADNEDDGTGVTVLGYNDSAADTITIPSKLGELPVQGIGDGAFNGFTRLTAIKIPNTVTEFGKAILAGCSNLESVFIPYNVTVIPSESFYQCSSLKKVSIPTSVERICQGAFMECDSLETVTYYQNSKGSSLSPTLEHWNLIYISDIGDGNTALKTVQIVPAHIAEALPTVRYDLTADESSFENGMNTVTVRPGTELRIDWKVSNPVSGSIALNYDLDFSSIIRQGGTYLGGSTGGAYHNMSCDDSETAENGIIRVSFLAENVPKPEDYIIFSWIFTVPKSECVCETGLELGGADVTELKNVKQKASFFGLKIAVVDPRIDEHIAWAKENKDKFETFESTPELQELRDFLLKDEDIANYKFIKNVKALMSFGTDTQGANDYYKDTANLIIADILTNPCFQNSVITESESITLEKKYIIIKFCKECEKNFELSVNLSSTLDEAVAAVDKSGILAGQDKILKAWTKLTTEDKLFGIDEYLDFLGSEVSCLMEYMEDAKNTRETYSDYLDFAIQYQASKELLDKALLFLQSCLYDSGKNVDIGLKSQSVLWLGEIDNRLNWNEVYNSFRDARIMLDSITALDAYYQAEQEGLFADFTIKSASGVSKIVFMTVAKKLTKDLCPAVWLYNAIDAGLSLSIYIMENTTTVKDKEMHRDISLFLILFYDAIGNAMRTHFTEHLEKEHSHQSVDVFEMGMGIYKSIHSMLVEQISLYLADLSEEIYNAAKCAEEGLTKMQEDSSDIYNRDDYRNYFSSAESIYNTYLSTGVLDQLFFTDKEKLHEQYTQKMTALMAKQRKNRINILFRTRNLKCCDEGNIIIKSVLEGDIVSVACPVNVTVRQGDTILVNIQNDKIVMRSDLCYAMLFESEDSPYKEKMIYYPEGCEVEISGFADGTMDIMKTSAEDKNDFYYAANVPVSAGSKYEEIREHGQTVQIAYDLNTDGIMDGNVQAFVPNVFSRTESLVGDVNGDGNISVEDAQLTLSEYVHTMSGLDSSFTEVQKLAADVNGDHQLSVDDAQTILLYYVNNTLSGKLVTWEDLLGKKPQGQQLPFLGKLKEFVAGDITEDET